MKYLSIVCLFLVISLCNSGYTQEKWYSFDENQNYVTDFLLEPGDTKTVTIDSNVEISVGFKSNATFEQSKKYFVKGIYPIEFRQKNTGNAISTTFGGHMSLTPVNGKIVLLISNVSQDNFKIVIYTKNKPNNSLQPTLTRRFAARSGG